MVNDAVPPLRDALPIGMAPLKKATRPVAVAGDTFAVMVTFWLRWAIPLGETAVIVVVVEICEYSGTAAAAKMQAAVRRLRKVTRFPILRDLDKVPVRFGICPLEHR